MLQEAAGGCTLLADPVKAVREEGRHLNAHGRDPRARTRTRPRARANRPSERNASGTTSRTTSGGNDRAGGHTQDAVRSSSSLLALSREIDRACCKVLHARTLWVVQRGDITRQNAQNIADLVNDPDAGAAMPGLLHDPGRPGPPR